MGTVTGTGTSAQVADVRAHTVLRMVEELCTTQPDLCMGQKRLVSISHEDGVWSWCWNSISGRVRMKGLGGQGQRQDWVSCLDGEEGAGGR